MTIDRDVGRPRIVRRRFDQADAAPLRQVLRRDVAPGLPFILRDVDQPVVGPGPDQPLGQRRRRDRKHRVVVLGAGVVDGDGPARRLLLRLVIARQVGADRFPFHSAVGGFEDALAAVVDRVRIVRRNHDRRRPLKAVFQIGRAARIRKIGPHRNVLHLAGAFVEARDVALVVARINNIRIGRIGRDVSGFSAAYRIPVVAPDFAVIAAAGNRDRRIVLLRAVHVIRIARVGGHVIELRGRLIVLPGPALAAIQADCHAAIVAGNHAPGVLRIDPQSVIVAVRNFDLVERASAIGGPEELHVEDVNRVRVLRIGDHVHVIPGPLVQAVTAIHQIPAVAAIVRAIEATLFRLDDRVHAIRVRCHRHTDSSVGTLRQSVLFDSRFQVVPPSVER